MELQNLKTLFVSELQDLYSAEQQLVKALPKMAKAANDKGLKSAFDDHLSETKVQVERIQQVLELLGEKKGQVKCKAMAGLIEEGDEVIEAAKEGQPFTIDAALIAAAQKVEHYEIASYGAAVAHADVLGLTEASALLSETLEEETAANESLNMLAEGGINNSAMAESSDTKSANGKSMESNGADSKSMDSKGANGKNANGRNADGKNAGNESAGNRNAGNEVAGGKSFGSQNAGTKSADSKREGSESSGRKNTGSESIGNRGLGNETAGSQGARSKK